MSTHFSSVFPFLPQLPSTLGWPLLLFLFQLTHPYLLSVELLLIFFPILTSLLLDLALRNIWASSDWLLMPVKTQQSILLILFGELCTACDGGGGGGPTGYKVIGQWKSLTAGVGVHYFGKNMTSAWKAVQLLVVIEVRRYQSGSRKRGMNIHLFFCICIAARTDFPLAGPHLFY